MTTESKEAMTRLFPGSMAKEVCFHFFLDGDGNEIKVIVNRKSGEVTDISISIRRMPDLTLQTFSLVEIGLHEEKVGAGQSREFVAITTALEETPRLLKTLFAPEVGWTRFPEDDAERPNVFIRYEDDALRDHVRSLGVRIAVKKATLRRAIEKGPIAALTALGSAMKGPAAPPSAPLADLLPGALAAAEAAAPGSGARPEAAAPPE